MGDIYIRRDIQDSRIFSDHIVYAWWTDLVLMSNHEPTKILVNGSLVDVPTGVVAVNLKNLADRWKVKKGKVSWFLSLLQEDNIAKVDKVSNISFINMRSRYVRICEDV